MVSSCKTSNWVTVPLAALCAITVALDSWADSGANLSKGVSPASSVSVSPASSVSVPPASSVSVSGTAAVTDTIGGGVSDTSDSTKKESPFYRFYLQGWRRNNEGLKREAIAAFDQSIKLHPGYQAAYLARAKAYFDVGESERALKDADDAIKLDATWWRPYAVRGQMRLLLGNEKGAAEDFNKAVELDPKRAADCRGRAAAILEVDAKAAGKYAKNLKKADVAFGEAQLRQMIADRPQMAPFVSPGDPVWNWMVRQFAGEGIGSRILWDGTPPDRKDCMACHNPPDYRSPGSIQLRTHDRNGSVAKGEGLWSSAVFELFNIRNAEGFHKVNGDALAGRITRDEYIREYCHAEFDAELLRSWFYRKIWLPHAVKNNLTASDWIWRVDNPATFERFFALFTDKTRYPFVPYGAYFDGLAKHRKQRLAYIAYVRSLNDCTSRALERPHESKDFVKSKDIVTLRGRSSSPKLDDTIAAKIRASRQKLAREIEFNTYEANALESWGDGRIGEASDWYKRALKVRQRMYGHDNPQVASTASSLANAFAKQKRYKDAIKMHKFALRIREKHYGHDHYTLAETLSRLSAIYFAMGNHARADELRVRASFITSSTNQQRKRMLRHDTTLDERASSKTPFTTPLTMRLAELVASHDFAGFVFADDGVAPGFLG